MRNLIVVMAAVAVMALSVPALGANNFTAPAAPPSGDWFDPDNWSVGVPFGSVDITGEPYVPGLGASIGENEGAICVVSSGDAMTDGFTVGYHYGPYGRLDITGGTLGTTNYGYIGMQGSGEINISGGDLNMMNNSWGSCLNLGVNGGGVVTLNMSSGNLNGTYGGDYLGAPVRVACHGETATINQSGGHINIGALDIVRANTGGYSATALYEMTNDAQLTVSSSLLLSGGKVLLGNGANAVATWRIIGDQASINMNSFSQDGAHSTLHFQPGSGGASTVNVTASTFVITADNGEASFSSGVVLKVDRAVGTAPMQKDAVTNLLTTTDGIYDSGLVVDTDTDFWNVTVGANDITATFLKYTGDADLDDDVDISDLGDLATSYGTMTGMGWNNGDFDNDGDVDISDLGLLATYYGSGTGGSGGPVPEPATLALLGLGGLALLRRRRRK